MFSASGPARHFTIVNYCSAMLLLFSPTIGAAIFGMV